MTREVNLCALALVLIAGSALAQAAAYDTNDPAASLDIDGVSGGPNLPAIVNLTAWNCGGTMFPATGTLNFASNVGAAGSFEIIVSTGSIVAAANGGLAFPTGQILNIGFTSPLFFLNGVFLPRFDPLPPSPVSVPFSRDGQTDVTLQGVVVNPGVPGGFDMTQPSELHVTVSLPPTTRPGPGSDNSSALVNLSIPPYCWAPNGLPMFGTTYTQMHVSSNGRVTFNQANTSFAPTISAALTGPPFVGLWADFNPALGATITISQTTLGTIRVNYNNVIYGNLGGTSSFFYIDFDPNSGQIEIGDLSLVLAHPMGAAQFLGLSPGSMGPASDPGPVVFVPAGMGGAAGSPNEMIYDFGPSPLASFTAGVNQIFFVVVGGNYAWAAL